ncbi:DUF4440 domain-containing protein [Streptomyces albus subsp. chlorinus]|uniref:YybH family protein n=1 Tax=Streptomyces albus TaxID=1888 RepID=UPI00156E3982|nr:nuclear transport factor 2 family protein [Streptomyces albus]NSC25459.1 DUF4440 domain-containing protein [Streptomyces albus subsp. chlorinus]
MKTAKRTLPIAGIAILLTAGSFVGASAISVQADTANASSATSTSTAATAPATSNGKRTGAESPAELLRLLGERIKAKDLDGIIALHEPDAAVVEYDGSIARGHKGIREMYVEWFKSDPVLTVNPRQTVEAGGKRGKIRGRTASIMGDYTLEQNRPDGTRESFTGNFCDIVRQQPDGTWLYLQDNPYPPHH